MPAVDVVSARAGGALLDAGSDVTAPIRWLVRIVRLQSRFRLQSRTKALRRTLDRRARSPRTSDLAEVL